MNIVLPPLTRVVFFPSYNGEQDQAGRTETQPYQRLVLVTRLHGCSANFLSDIIIRGLLRQVIRCRLLRIIPGYDDIFNIARRSCSAVCSRIRRCLYSRCRRFGLCFWCRCDGRLIIAGRRGNCRLVVTGRRGNCRLVVAGRRGNCRLVIAGRRGNCRLVIAGCRRDCRLTVCRKRIERVFYRHIPVFVIGFDVVRTDDTAIDCHRPVKPRQSLLILREHHDIPAARSDVKISN